VRFVVAPAKWIVDTRALQTAPAPPPPAAEAPAKTEGGEPGKAPAIPISPDRKQKLQEAFRPPPQVPDDL
jgi:hypothetical protein